MTDENDKNKNRLSKEEDRSLWKLYTADIDPLDPDRCDESDDEIDAPRPLKKIKKKDSGNRVDPVAPAFVPAQDVHRAVQIDRRTEMRLKRGQMPIEACIDLHGLYQKDAKARLERFIEQSYYSGMRCVLVVTGKGKLILDGEEPDERTPGVIRRNFRGWLAEAPLNAYVLRAERAQIKDGGEGAFYVLLRKKR